MKIYFAYTGKMQMLYILYFHWMKKKKKMYDWRIEMKNILYMLMLAWLTENKKSTFNSENNEFLG